MGRGGDKKADGRPIVHTGEVVPLPMAEVVPAVPDKLEPEGAGADLWQRVWARAITWISPDSDMTTVVHACQLADDLEIARDRWRLTMDKDDARTMTAISKQLMDALSLLGFNPTARARLGVAEVKKMSALQSLVDRRAAAQRG